MPNDNIDSDPMILLAQAAKLKLFVMLRRTVKADQQKSALGAHLAWIIGAETQGKIFLSGPGCATRWGDTTGWPDDHPCGQPGPR